MSNFEIEKTLVSSTAHVTQKDFSLLSDIALAQTEHSNKVNIEKDDIPFYVYLYEYGTVLRLVGDFSFSKFPTDLFSEGLMDLVIFCISLDCSAIKLDCDGPVYSGFKTYDW